MSRSNFGVAAIGPATLVAVAALVLAASSAGAAVVVQYQFGTTGQETTVETGAPYSATSTLPGALASAITDPNGTIGLEISSAATTPPNAPFLRIDPQGNAADPNAAQTNNKYFQFTLTAAAGADVDLSSLTFNVERGGAGTPRGFFIRTSADNFASTLTAVGLPALTANAVNAIGNDVNTARPAYTAVTADLSGAAFQNIQNQPGRALTFEFFSYAPAATNSVDYDDITLNGTVVAPEPASLGLLGVPALGLVARRRCRTA